VGGLIIFLTLKLNYVDRAAVEVNPDTVIYGSPLSLMENTQVGIFSVGLRVPLLQLSGTDRSRIEI